MRMRLHGSVITAVALLLGSAEGAAAKCAQPLRIGGVPIAVVVVDGVVLESQGEIDDLDPETIHAVRIECWRLSEHGVTPSELSPIVILRTSPSVAGPDDAGRPGGPEVQLGNDVGVIICLTKAWTESMGLSDDELVEVALRKATPGLMALMNAPG